MKSNKNEIISGIDEYSIDVSLTEEKATLLATLYAKALDCQSRHSLLHDHYSLQAIKKINYNFNKLKLGKNQGLGIVTRAHLFDKWTEQFLEQHNTALVLQLGCGLDTRVYRINSKDNVKWIDIDYPEVIEIRRKIYPERDNYKMIGSSVTKWEWMQSIPGTQPTLIIAEGLLMYLEKEEVKSLIQKMVSRFSNGQLIFDSISSLAIKLERLNPVLRNTRARLRWGLDNVHEVESWNDKLKLTQELFVSDFAKIYKEKFSVQYRFTLKLMGQLSILNKLGRITRFRF